MTCPSCSADNEPGVEVCFRCGRHLTALTQGAVIASRYEIVSLLGVGGMGRVYKAKDLLLDEAVAIKVLRSELGTPEMAQRFRAELKLARKVSHPNVCRIHEYGEDGTTRFISMALIEGTDLGKVMRRHPAGLPHDEAFRIALQVADGLQAIHDAGIIHRDLKAQNIVVDEASVVRLMDFGIAKDSSIVRGMTATGQVVGTPEYMSPEQCRGGSLDFRSDVYSLAVVIYEVFNGRVPFLGESVTATLLMQLQDPPPLDGQVASRLPPGLADVLRKALAKEPAERYASAAEVAAALREIRQRPARPPAEAPPAAPPPHDRRRHSRLGISVDVILKRTGTDGGTLQDERTVADNIGKSGARVMTSMTGLAAGDTVHLREVGGAFETRAAVRHVYAGPDRIQRLGLEFLDHPAPDRLAPSGEPRPLTRPDAPARKTPAPSEERRRDSRFEVTLDVVLAWQGPDGQREERTIADNIGQSGARVMTTLPVALGDSVSVTEVGGDFHTRAVVRSVRAEGRDVRRLGLEFLDRRAPARLVPGGEATDRHPRPSTPAPGPPPAEAEERRRRILTAYERLPTQDHFEVLGLTSAATAAEVKEAYVRLCKVFHPDVQAHPATSDLRPQSDAVFLRLKEAYEVLADAEQRARYERRLGRPVSTPPAVPVAREAPAAGAMDEETLALKAEVVVRQAKKMMAEGQYWDAIQALEAALETTGGHRASQAIRILLGRATSKNPKWLKRAADTLLTVIGEDPGSVEAHFELGVVYKAAGLKSRARAELRRALELDPGHAAAAAELRLLDGDHDEPSGQAR